MSRRPEIEPLAAFTGAVLLYVVGASLGLWLARGAYGVAVFWPANALLLGFLLRPPGRPPHAATLAACALAACANAVLHGEPAQVALGRTVADMAEVWVGYHAVRRLAGPVLALESVRELSVLILVAITAPAVGATLGAGFTFMASGAPYGAVWFDWWGANAAGMALFLPLAMRVRSHAVAEQAPRGWRGPLAQVEPLAPVALLGAALCYLLANGFQGRLSLLTPGLLWLALRFGIGAVAAGVAAIGTAIAVTAHGISLPILAPAPVPEGGIVPLLLFIAITALPSLAVAVAMAEREREQRRLALALEGASEGFWDWEAASARCLLSARCAEMVGLPAVPTTATADEWRASVHPDDYAAAAASLEDHLAGRTARFESEYRCRHADGGWIWVHDRGKVVARDAQGRPLRVVGTKLDITARKLLEQRVERMAMHDPLTDLANRAMFRRELGHARARAERSGHKLGVLLVDLDRFKPVNDTWGHAIGDALLVEVAARLRGCVREGDLVARLGGDEFAVLAEARDVADLAAVARRIVARLGEPARLLDGGASIEPAASVGLALFPDDARDPDRLVIAADRALYAAKAAGRGRWIRYRAENDQPSARDPRPALLTA